MFVRGPPRARKLMGSNNAARYNKTHIMAKYVIAEHSMSQLICYTLLDHAVIANSTVEICVA